MDPCFRRDDGSDGNYLCPKDPEAVSGRRKHQMPDLSLGRTNLDFNVVAKPREAIHQFSLGQIGEVTTHHVGHLGLGNAHSFGSLYLSQTAAAHGLYTLGWVMPIRLAAST